jgi:hypothetical protein
MADSPISGLSSLTEPASNDLLVVVDVSDTTQSASGSTKNLTPDNLSKVIDHTQVLNKGSNTHSQIDSHISSTVLHVPSPTGNSGKFLTTNGSALSWGEAGGGGAAFWGDVPGSPARASDTTFTLTDTGNANKYDLIFKKGVIVRWLETTTFRTGMVVSSSYADNVVTVTIVGDAMAAGSSSIQYCLHMALLEQFIIPGTLGALTDAAKTFFAPYDLYPLCVDAMVKTAGTTNATVFDLNDDGTTIITTKPSIASGSTTDFNNTVDAASTAIEAGSLITVDIDSVSSTAPVEAYLYFYYYPTSWRYRS